MMKKSSKSKSNYKFIVFVAALTLPISAVFDTSTIFLNTTTWYIGAIVVVCIVFIGALFDMLGMAAAAARETPFHAMASKRVFGARRAIAIVRNAEKVSSVCSDVIGDIAGVLSGAGALAVSVQLLATIHVGGWRDEAVKIAITAVITSLTVGGKAIGKTVAIHSPTPIILFAARLWETVSFVDRGAQRRKK
ncbi:hypothetical protein NZD89_13490 [Alicyclobacillus fastidiosus]|uniref:CNNM transmembrane domain-containing protein n=1 Tax=Alicyclobacillus fastidiosus TaxID=392011 RepID=A0ABY6ZN94_9BACL|nr:hypothetical protein [Alicyclobacillus fastidiosus]WAH44305.1 hypothetical protein NZD89_13490 [Alicyclobacillus fastidiosus]